MAHLHLEGVVERCSTLGHIKQLQAHLLTSGIFHARPAFRARFLELCALSPSCASLPHALLALRSLRPHHRPSANDFNPLLRALASSPNPLSALSLFSRLLLSHSPPTSPRPDALSLSFALKACARSSSLAPALQLHSLLLRLGFSPDPLLATTLLDAYAKSGDLPRARRVFDEMPIRDVATWNALLSGLALGPDPRLALALFRRLRASLPSLPAREAPNDITVVAALSACALLGDLAEGAAVHRFARARGLDAGVRVRNALIDMYSKCGSLDRAVAVFRAIGDADRTVVSYNAVLLALATHGRGLDALRVFDEMPRKLQPDAVTYLAVLCGCTHAGLVDDGLRVFRAMRGVAPSMKHYGAVVDLLGRAGRLAEARDTIASMPFPPDAVLWQTLLGACKTYGDVALAELAAAKLAEMGSNVDGDYVLLSNVYAAKARWTDVGRIRDAMRSNDVRKVPGFSYTEVGGVVHGFVNGDTGHERWREIYRALEDIAARIGELGYEPETGDVLHDIGEEEKQNALYHHSEKLTIAFGLISTPPGETIRVIKNLRICRDCHLAAKLISKAYSRVIVVRDTARFHRFEGGECSCKDYW
ncbi:pentatricopeptide repeat-containing protein OGR1, mitochondrial [Ananas comosus]|uniref:Pentatricopeptide repeat-containing protein OGR1, mitochondrial n=1 Tax=Ananas comosus TaxID=4615 RepID=A0A6P5F1U2_ANACO|nr:pentatricopeptide repeat-containing protein OGR1, mitochondrial [Ananas comosus]